MRWILFGLGLLFLALGAERVWRLRRQPATVTKSSINAVLFSVGLAGPAYSFVTADSALYPFTQALWHLMVCVLIGDRKSTRLNSSHVSISYAVFCLKKKTTMCCGKSS